MTKTKKEQELVFNAGSVERTHKRILVVGGCGFIGIQIELSNKTY